MSTRIEIEYDRQFPNADLQALIARTNATINVLNQLGVAYQTLPGLALAVYQTDLASLVADLAALNALIDQIRPLLIAMDAKAQPLHERNQAALKTLDGLLTNDADRTVLAQITGPTSHGSSTPPAPPTP